LNSIFLEESSKDKLWMVVTDGHRLALVERAVGSVRLKKGRSVLSAGCLRVLGTPLTNAGTATLGPDSLKKQVSLGRTKKPTGIMLLMLFIHFRGQ
jgi:hypothetical protein